jgi:hypothetical protein
MGYFASSRALALVQFDQTRSFAPRPLRSATLAGIVRPDQQQRSHVDCHGRAPDRSALRYRRHHEADRGLGGTGMSRILTAALFVLTLSAPALADTVPKGFTLRAYPPVGNGDPNAISCWAWRTTPPVRGLQCARNSHWARLNGRTPNWDSGALQRGQPPQMSGGWPWQYSSNNR